MTMQDQLQEKMLQLAYEKQQLGQFRQLHELLSNGLAAILSAEHKDELFGKLFEAIIKVIAYDSILILQLNKSHTSAHLLASVPKLSGDNFTEIPAESPLLQQDLNLSDLSSLPWWQQSLQQMTAGYQSALTYPLRTPYSSYLLILLSRKTGAFSADCAAALRSFSTFVASTLSQLEKRTLLEERDKLREQQYRIEQSLLRQEKMAAIGQLAAGVAHELNNPLGFIYCNLNTLSHYMEQHQRFIQQSLLAHPDLSELADSLKLDYIRQESRDLLEESLTGARRARDIINNLRTFSHPDEKTLQHVDLRILIRDTARIAQTQVKHNAKISLELPDEAAMLNGNATQLAQVLLNLLINANHAVDTGKGAIQLILKRANQQWLLQVTDNGCGIAENIVVHIFEPFFTTKPIGQGTGLGLSLSRAIAEQHGGSLILAATGTTGSCFELRLPVLELS
jgi:signal transduction histidine kinase